MDLQFNQADFCDVLTSVEGNLKMSCFLLMIDVNWDTIEEPCIILSNLTKRFLNIQQIKRLWTLYNLYIWL